MMWIGGAGKFNQTRLRWSTLLRKNWGVDLPAFEGFTPYRTAPRSSTLGCEVIMTSNSMRLWIVAVLCCGAVVPVRVGAQSYPPPAGAGIVATLQTDQN